MSLLPATPSTAPPMRGYQSRAVAEVLAAWRAGVRRVLLVAPTGAGKTRMGVEFPELASELLGRPARVLAIAHRIELVGQMVERFRQRGYDAAGISPRYQPDPWAQIQVAGVDTLLARGMRPAADLLLWDEAHHAAAETYSTVLQAYTDVLQAGLTATPQRRDGKPMADHYDLLVVAAQYSELLASGDLVPCRVARPDEYLGSDLARPPLEEWQAKANGALTFGFAQTVKLAKQYADEFNAAGIESAAVDANTPEDERAELLERFRAGEIRVLWNVYVFTEGVDVPAAECCLLARGVSHAGPYLQIVGRVLRPFPGKTSAMLLDLSGASHLHGYPTQDREYGLDGRPIRVVGEALKNCPQCGACVPVAVRVCECGYEWPRVERALPRVWDLELKWAIDEAGGDPAAVGDDVKYKEWTRLVGEMVARNWSIGFIRKEYAGLFGEEPDPLWVSALDVGVKERELAKLRAVAEKRGYKEGWVSYRFKAIFGHWPKKRTA